MITKNFRYSFPVLAFLLFVVLTPTLSAAEYTKDFNIKSISLGMNKDILLKKLPCTKPKIKNSYIGIKNYGSVYKCIEKNSEGQKTGYTEVKLDNNREKIIGVFYKHYFKEKPNWSIIESKLFKKFGETKFTSTLKLYEEESVKSYCWGKCYKNKFNNLWELNGEDQGLQIRIRKSSQESERNINFELIDWVGLSNDKKGARKKKEKDDSELNF